MLQILLLGAPVVLLNEQPVLIRRRLQRSMLFYLASHPEPVSRSDLIMLFWPDAGEQDGRRHLREALSKLRAQLDDSQYWLVDQDRIGLNPEYVSVDVRDFLRAAGDTEYIFRQTPRHVTLPLAVYHSARVAVQLWRANRFLSGVSLYSGHEFDEWLTNITQDLENARLGMIERLGYHAAASGDLTRAVQLMRQVLEIDIQNENLYNQVLLWLRTLGLRAEISKTCAQIEAVYKRETGGPPPPMLAETCRQLRSETHSQPTTRTLWPLPARIQPPFVGRIYALEQLNLLIQRGGTAVVYGEAGAGKTRLVQHFYETQTSSPRLLFAQARSAESGLPFQPLIEMLRSTVQDAEWRRLDNVWLSALSPLLPELMRMVPTTPLPLDSRAPDSRGNIFEALRQLLLVLDGNERMLFFLDDAHWSDQATLSALAYLQDRQFFQGRGLLILSARQGERSPNLEEFLQRSHAEQNLHQFPLRQLSTDEIADLAHHTLNHAPPEKLVTRLEHDTGGNPLFLIEILRAWLDLSPRPDLESVESLPLASSIHSLLHERLRALHVRSRGVLQAAAVIGHNFSLSLLEQVSGLSSEQVMLAIEDLERYYLVRPDLRGSLDSYAFIHEKFREVLLRELSPARRRYLHQRAAQALQTMPPGKAGAQAAVLAGHYYAAGDAHQAYHMWLEAAAYARSLLSLPEAYSAYQHADDLLPHLASSLEADEIYSLYGPWGEAASEISDAPMMQRVYSAMHSFGKQHRSPLLIGAGLSGIAQLAFLQRDFGTALDSLQQGIRYLQQTDNPFELVQALTRLGSLLTMMSRFDEAIQLFQNAAALGEKTTDERTISSSFVAADWLALIYILTGWPEKAVEMASQTMRARQMQLQVGENIRNMFTCCAGLYYSGQFQKALELCQSGLKLAERLGAPRENAVFHFFAGASSLGLANLDQAWEHAYQSLTFSERANYKEVTSLALALQGDLYSLSDNGSAVDVYQKAIHPDPNPLVGVYVRYRLAIATALSGAVEQAVSLVEEAVAVTDRAGLRLFYVPAVIAQANILRIQGKFEQAEQILNNILPDARERGLLPCVLTGEEVLGEVCLAQGRWEAAAQCGQRLVESAQLAAACYAELQGLRLQARAGHALGQTLTPAQYERALALLTEREAHARLPEIAPLFQHCRDQILAELQQ